MELLCLQALDSSSSVAPKVLEVPLVLVVPLVLEVLVVPELHSRSS